MSELIVDIKGLKKSFGKTQAVAGITLGIAPSELFGIVGPDGAGKTSTIRMMVGLMDADQGSVDVLGERQKVGASRTREFIGYMPQQYSLYGDLSVWENMTFFGRLFGLDKRSRVKRATELLDLVGLGRFHDRRADALSGGMYKKLAVACALLHRPKLLVLDEPTNGVDPVSRRELWALLYDLVKDGRTVVVSTPDMDEASRCHRVALLNSGAVLAVGAPNEMVANFKHTVLVAQTTERREVESMLLRRDDVFDCSPESIGLRVLARGDGALVRAALQGVDSVSHLQEISPHFEDVYLSLIQQPQDVEEPA